jgi:hypothetical protein
MKLRDSTRYNTFATRRLATAFTAALIGGAVLSTPAQAVTLADNNGLGDAVIYQYYTTKNDWRTFFRLLNTSNLPVVVKVRYREAANSREVLDFEVALSPQDMWAGWTDPNVTIAGTTGPGIKTGDTSCLFPLVGQSNPATEGFAVQADGTVGALFKDRAFTGDYDDNGPYPGDPTLRMGEGHFEIIGVTAAPAGSLFDLAVSHQNSDGEPENCSAAYTYYLSGNGGLGLDVPNALAANAYLVNVNSGQGAGYDPNILATCRTTDIRALAVATDTTPDLDDCDAGTYGIPAIAIDGVNAYNGTYAVNQALWNGTTPPDVTQTIFQADVDGSGAITPAPLFNFDLNNDGVCNQPEEIGISEEDVDESIYNAVGLDPVGVIPTVAGGCNYRFGTSQTQGPGVTATLDVTSPGAWRIKQKGQVTYAPDPDFPLDLTNQYLVSGGVDWVSSLFMADTVINEWAASNNPGAIITDYFTQWVLTFPTKNYYVDLQDDVNLGDDISPTLARTVPATFAPFGNPPVGSSIFPGNGESCEPVSLFMYNREERFSAFTSPAPTPDNSLCWETNVVTFNQNYADAGLDSDFTFVIDELDLPTDFDGQTSERGWARMWFTGAGANTGLVIPGTTLVQYGLPVTGFLFSIYETGDAATNHTTINAHKYERSFGPSQARPPRTN